jgi:tRNA-binding protein
LWYCRVDFGEIGTKQTSAQVTKNYQLIDLLGKQVLGLVNIPTRNIAGFVSEFLLLGLEDENGGIVLIQPESKVKNGEILK